MGEQTYGPLTDLDSVIAEALQRANATTPLASQSVVGAPPNSSPVATPGWAEPAANAVPETPAPLAPTAPAAPEAAPAAAPATDALAAIAPPPGHPTAASEQPLAAHDIFSDDLKDYIDPELLGKLRSEAMGDSNMSIPEALALAGVATANPAMASQLLLARTQGQAQARQFLASLQTQAGLAKREQMRLDAADRRTHETLSESTKKAARAVNAKLVTDAAAQASKAGVKVDYPVPTGADLEDDEKVQGYLSAVNVAADKQQEQGKQLQDDMTLIQKAIEGGVMDPNTAEGAMKDALRRAGISDQEIETKWSGRIGLMKSAAQSAAATAAAQRNLRASQARGLQLSQDQAAQEMQLAEQKLMLQKQALDQREIEGLYGAVDRMMTQARTFAAYSNATTLDPATKAQYATDAQNAENAAIVMQTRLKTLMDQNAKLGVQRSVDFWVNTAWQRAYEAAAQTYGIGPNDMPGFRAQVQSGKIKLSPEAKAAMSTAYQRVRYEEVPPDLQHAFDDRLQSNKPGIKP